MGKFVSEGGAIDYTPAADVAAGEVVVVGNIFGVANREILTGKLGALAVKGIFALPKNTSLAFSAGDKCYWDTGATEVNATDTNPKAGLVVADAATADEEVLVNINTFS